MCTYIIYFCVFIFLYSRIELCTQTYGTCLGVETIINAELLHAQHTCEPCYCNYQDVEKLHDGTVNHTRPVSPAAVKVGAGSVQWLPTVPNINYTS